MPILAGPTTVTTATNNATFSWTDPYGTNWDLSNPTLGWFAARGITGLGAIPIKITTDERDRGGETIRRIQPATRMITLPLLVEGTTHTQFLTRWRDLAHAFTSTRYAGPGQFTVTRPDGTQRRINARYEAGWDGDPDLGVTSDLLALTLRCPTPWWQGTTQITETRAYDSGDRDYLSPYPAVSSGSTLGNTTITNLGGVETWPSWTITGPASEIIATSNTTGESWTLTPSATGHGDLLAGETVTITTDPQTVRGPANENWLTALTWPDATLWALQPGTNDIEYTVTGSGVGTSATLTYYPQYETA